jgi:hypothetical protein
LCGLVAPGLDISLAPFAQAIENWPASLDNSIPHGHVATRSLGLAPVVAWGTVIARNTGND